MSREEDICLYMQSDKVWPGPLNTPTQKRFDRALTEVLRRLPDDIFDTIETDVTFVVQEPTYWAINVPYSHTVPPRKTHFTFKIDQVIIFSTAFELSDIALVGLIAHEIAHSIEERRDHSDNEVAADERVRAWGFEKELAEMLASKHKE
ncbi:MAG: hypothetical protein A2283_19005 [Lentisphaerae bacterium RIFOXYA12_FULL_48_11]|nr:MAG: hypothetical protein A2283_19005 [Lentisphaerae bacterium RIFOXYA12_FULL_48_11]